MRVGHPTKFIFAAAIHFGSGFKLNMHFQADHNIKLHRFSFSQLSRGFLSFFFGFLDFKMPGVFLKPFPCLPLNAQSFSGARLLPGEEQYVSIYLRTWHQPKAPAFMSSKLKASYPARLLPIKEGVLCALLLAKFRLSKQT
jgi:hypothetical protein